MNIKEFLLQKRILNLLRILFVELTKIYPKNTEEVNTAIKEIFKKFQEDMPLSEQERNIFNDFKKVI